MQFGNYGENIKQIRIQSSNFFRYFSNWDFTIRHENFKSITDRYKKPMINKPEAGTLWMTFYLLKI